MGNRWRGLVLIAALAVASFGVGNAWAASTGPVVVLAVPSSPRAARAEAKVFLRRLSLPADAVRLSGEPTGDGQLLSGPFAPFLANLVYVTGFWRVREPGQAVLSYIQAHLPAGSTPGSPPQGGLWDGWTRRFWTWDLFWPVSSLFGYDHLSLVIAELKDGSTGVRADALVRWLAPVLPSGVMNSVRLMKVAAQIANIDPKKVRVEVKHFSIASVKRAKALGALLNSLQPPPDVLSCPGSNANYIPVKKRVLERIQLALYAKRAQRPRAWVDITAGGFCGGGATVKVTVRGSHPNYAFSPKAFQPIVAALGLKIHAQQT